MKTAVIVLALLCGSCSMIPGFRAYDEVQAREGLKYNLFDPGSAQFDRVTNVVAVNPETPAICGYVNAKNKMGAYIGYRRFVLFPKEGAAFMDMQVDYPSSSAAERQEQRNFNAAWRRVRPRGC